MRRVAITGMGAVSPLGAGVREAWASALSGDTAPRGIDVSRYVTPKEARRLDPFVQYALAAASQAIDEAGLGGAELTNSDVIIGSARGGIRTLEDACARRPGAFTMSASTVGMAASYIAIRYGITGRTLGVSNACASGLYAIGEAYESIRHGRCAIAIAGGAEAPVCKLAIEGYGRAGVLSRSGIVRPFDASRDGFVLAEGAAVMVLEDYEAATARGARILGEVKGFGASSDASHETAPSADGQALAIRRALSGIEDVSAVFAHATATRLGDRTEARALMDAFSGNVPPVCALKSMTGHMLGASGAFEAVMAVLALRESALPPTPTLIDSEFPEIPCSAYAQRIDGNAALCCSFGFGGTNAALLIGV